MSEKKRLLQKSSFSMNKKQIDSFIINSYWLAWINNINKILELDAKLDKLHDDIRGSEDTEFCNKTKKEIQTVKNQLRKARRKASLNMADATRGLRWRL